MKTLWLLSRAQPEIQVFVCQIFDWLFNVLHLILIGTSWQSYSQSAAVQPSTCQQTQLKFGVTAVNSVQWIPPLFLHDIHFVRLINAENLLSLRARDMAIIFTRHTT